MRFLTGTGSAWIISSSSTRPISAGSSAATAATTTPRGPTNRSTTTVPSHESWSPRHVAASLRFRRSAGSIIAISGSPDRRRDQPPPVRVIQHAPAGSCRDPGPRLCLLLHGDHEHSRPRCQRKSRSHSSSVRRNTRRVGPMGFLTRTGIFMRFRGPEGLRDTYGEGQHPGLHGGSVGDRCGVYRARTFRK